MIHKQGWAKYQYVLGSTWYFQVQYVLILYLSILLVLDKILQNTFPVLETILVLKDLGYCTEVLSVQYRTFVPYLKNHNGNI